MRKVELPSDSTFAVAMRNSQQAEREEQQRIKNLVLNYDMRENEEQDGDLMSNPFTRSSNVHTRPGNDRPSSFYVNRSERISKNRGGQRIRKLQLSDVDWYANFEKPSLNPLSPGVQTVPGDRYTRMNGRGRNNKRGFGPSGSNRRLGLRHT